MKSSRRMAPAALLVLMSACTAEPAACPGGTEKLGSRCAPVTAGTVERGDAGSEDAGIEDEADGSADLATDAGPDTADPACSEPGCEADAPEQPEIQAAASMAPGRELWAWSMPSGTDYFELLVDGEPPASAATTREARFSAPLEPGDHTLQVRACDAQRRCSPPASHVARVESFGAELPRGLRDAARTLAPTALGHRVAIACNDCAEGPAGEVYNLEGAVASIERALERGADLIELNVASIAGGVYASPSDSPSAGARPLLADLLGRDELANADALLALEVVEGAPEAADTVLPDDFAKALFAVIDGAPSIARNGRPLWLRTNHANRGYLQALAAEAARHPVTGPYVRFIASDPGREPGAFYGDDVLVPSLDFADAVSVDFRLSNLAFRLERLRAAGTAAIVENVPGPGHGELVLAALREQADVFLTNYRVDQARAIVSTADTGAYFGAQDISADGRVLAVHGVRSGAPVRWERELGVRIAGETHARPKAILGASEPDFWGPYLSFAGENETAARALQLTPSDVAQEQGPGFLVSFSGTLSLAYGSSAFSSSGAASDWQLLLMAGGPAAAEERDLAVAFRLSAAAGSPASLVVPAIGGAGCASQNQPFMSPLEDGELRWIVLAFDRGNLTLLIDGRCAARATVAVGGQADLAAHMVLGTGFANLYRGAMQQLNVLRWAPTTGHSEN